MAERQAGAPGKRAMAAGLLLVAALLAACASGSRTATSFNVFFPADSAALSADAEAIVAQAAQAIQHQRPASVTIAAGADSNASIKLAEPRYLAVRQGLEARGVDGARITRASLPQIEANAGSTAMQRVEIILSPNP